MSEAPRPALPGGQVWARTILLAGATLVLAALLAPYWPWPPEESLLALHFAQLVAFAAVSGMTLASGATVGAPTARAMAVWIPVAAVLAGLAWLEVPALTGAAAIAASATVTMALLVGGTVTGGVIGGRIAAPGHLAIVFVVSSLADVWSVSAPSGPSAAVVASAPLLSVLALPFPLLGTDFIAPLLGVGDVAFVALYLTASRRFGLGVRRSAAALAVGFVVTWLVMSVLERAIPALPFLGAAMWLAHPEARLPPPHERLQALVAVGLLAGLAFAVLALRA